MKLSVWQSVFPAVLLIVLVLAAPCPAQTVADPPQETVECSGWHAVCALATDCKLAALATGPAPPTATCDCWKVTEQHMVMTSNIKNETFGNVQMKELTQAVCTNNHPCGLDEAPVCSAIKAMVPNDHWVSTFSYRGWCKNWDPVKCEGLWADCMTSACTESQKPKDPNRPLSCHCTLHASRFVGTNGRCSAQPSTVMSTIRIETWDFDNNTFAFSVAGDDYVKEACSPIKSDPQ